MKNYKSYKEIANIIIETSALNEDDYTYIGFRIANEVQEIGDIVEIYSKSNADREDDREFPEFGTEGYDELEELDGVCAYEVDKWNDYQREDIYECLAGEKDPDEDKEYKIDRDFLYILGTDEESNYFGEDRHEIILPEPKVLGKIVLR